MIEWTVAVPTFLAATVEWVEAFTIVLAVSLSIGWVAAVGAAVAALVTLAVMTVNPPQAVSCDWSPIALPPGVLPAIAGPVNAAVVVPGACWHCF